jgi:phosphoribosylformylglycinamidine cyclo-ligase
VAEREMYRTFNCGMGMIICVPNNKTDEALALLRGQGETAWLAGHVATAADGEEQVELKGL